MKHGFEDAWVFHPKSLSTNGSVVLCLSPEMCEMCDIHLRLFRPPGPEFLSLASFTKRVYSSSKARVALCSLDLRRSAAARRKVSPALVGAEGKRPKSRLPTGLTQAPYVIDCWNISKIRAEQMQDAKTNENQIECQLVRV